MYLLFTSFFHVFFHSFNVSLWYIAQIIQKSNILKRTKNDIPKNLQKYILFVKCKKLCTVKYNLNQLSAIINIDVTKPNLTNFDHLKKIVFAAMILIIYETHRFVNFIQFVSYLIQYAQSLMHFSLYIFSSWMQNECGNWIQQKVKKKPKMSVTFHIFFCDVLYAVSQFFFILNSPSFLSVFIIFKFK